MPRSCRRRQRAAAACAGSKRPQRCLLGFPRLPARLALSSSSPAMRCVTSGSSSAHWGRACTIDAIVAPWREAGRLGQVCREVAGSGVAAPPKELASHDGPRWLFALHAGNLQSRKYMHKSSKHVRTNI